METPYALLGVAANADADEISRAFRSLAKRYHPDATRGDQLAEVRFKAIAAAYDLLSDPVRRARFDRGSSAPTPTRDTSDVVADLFGGRAAANRPPRRYGVRDDGLIRGIDRHFRLTIAFIDAALGTTKHLRTPDGGMLEIGIPAGVEDGSVVRLAGRGEAGSGGGPPGDALVTLRIRSHAIFRREGDTIRLTLTISLAEAVLGGRIDVPTLDGPVAVAVPKGVSSGRVLRLRGMGIRAEGRTPGDLLATLQIALPATIDAELERLIADWAARHPHQPRGVSDG